MPVLSFRPTKARLVIEHSKESVLVMKVVASSDERLVLASGEPLASMSGVLRIREHKPYRDRLDRKATGTMVFVNETGPAKYQINITMAAKKFDALLQVALAGRTPTRFFLDAGFRTGPFGSRGITYESRRGSRAKVWNNRSHKMLPVADFSMILPIDLNDATVDHRPPPEFDEPAQASLATSAQVAELADELLAFQAETHYTLKAIVTIIGVILLLAVVFNVVLLYR